MLSKIEGFYKPNLDKSNRRPQFHLFNFRREREKLNKQYSFTGKKMTNLRITFNESSDLLRD